MSYDLVIRGRTIVDGTGAPSRPGDVAVLDGRISEVGWVTGRGREEIDAAVHRGRRALLLARPRHVGLRRVRVGAVDRDLLAQ